MKELVKDKTYYRIFDLNFKESTGIYSNKRSASRAEVAQNRKSVSDALKASKILTLNQVHGIEIIDADSILDFDLEPEGDGVVSTKQGVALCILTADCVPVLFSSEDGSVIGAAHSGWRSAKAGIISKISEEMRKKGAKKIKAAIGPSISQKSYEVGSEYYETFISEDSFYKRFFINSVSLDKYKFDLPAFVTFKLNQAGIFDIEGIFEDTYSYPDKYPSYRRSFERGENYKRHILSGIIIK